MTTPIQIQTLLNGPALAPPNGVEPNFENPSNLNTACYAIILSCLVATTIALCLRLYTRALIIRKVTLDDYIILLALLLFAGFCVPTLMLTARGLGIHQWDMQLKDMRTFSQLILAGSVVYCFAIFCTKFAILLQYLSIFTPQKKSDFMFWASYGLIWTNLVYYIIITFLELFPCHPVSKAWNLLIINGHCLNRNAVNVATAAINLLTDLLVLILPQQAIWNLQMSARRKVAISAVFLVGMLSCVAATVRMYYAVRIYQNSDYTYLVTLFGWCTLAEITFGIIACCLPTTPKFFQAMRKAKLIIGLESYVRTFLHKSGSGSYAKSSDHSDGRPSTSLHVSKEVKARPRHYTTLSESHEMLATSDKDTLNCGPRKEAIPGRNADVNIMRTVQIAAVKEDANDLVPDIEKGPVGPWDGRTHSHSQATRVFT